MPVRIGIIDYGMGNLKSVYKAFRFLKTNPIFIKKKTLIAMALYYRELGHLKME